MNLENEPIHQAKDILDALYRQNKHLLSKEPVTELWRIIQPLKNIPIINRLFIKKDEEENNEFKELLRKQQEVLTYREWHEVSLRLDELSGKNEWKKERKSDMYDYELVYNNLIEMREARLSKDYTKLLYLIRTKWVRNLGNMGDGALYIHCYVGTKQLIEEYVEECQKSLEYLVHGEGVKLDDRYLLDMLMQTRKNVGRTALVLSGGSTFCIFHIGVLMTLFEEDALPKIVSGSSAGSIVASILCSYSYEDTLKILNTIIDKKFNVFGNQNRETKSKDKKHGFQELLNKVSHLLKYSTLFDSTGIQETMIELVGDLTFREAYNRTGRILNITVSPTSNHEQTRLLNYLTAPQCLLWSACCASCSLPGIFPSTKIYEKIPETDEIREWNNDTSATFLDGSVDNDLPIVRLLEMFNVNHIIASQVNPHVAPLLKISNSSSAGEVRNELTYKFQIFLTSCYNFITSEVIHYLKMAAELNIQRNLAQKLITLFSQQYSGDITIVPDFNYEDYLKIFENPSPGFLLDFITRGVKASWPKITLIKNHCDVELALAEATKELKGRLILTSDDPNKKENDLYAEGNNDGFPDNVSLITRPIFEAPRKPQDSSSHDRAERFRKSASVGSTNTLTMNTTNKQSATLPTTPPGLKRNSIDTTFLPASGRSHFAKLFTGSLTTMKNQPESPFRPRHYSDIEKYNQDVYLNINDNKKNGYNKGNQNGFSLKRNGKSKFTISPQVEPRIEPEDYFEYPTYKYSRYDDESDDDGNESPTSPPEQTKEKANLPRLNSVRKSLTNVAGSRDKKNSSMSSENFTELLKNNFSQLSSPDIRRKYMKRYHDEKEHIQSKINFDFKRSSDAESSPEYVLAEENGEHLKDK